MMDVVACLCVEELRAPLLLNAGALCVDAELLHSFQDKLPG